MTEKLQVAGMQVYYTIDLNIFKEITANREVDRRHVKQLVAAIKRNNLLRVNPILVDRKMNVIDGQHRLEAARILKEGIYYMVDEHISQSDIATLNSNQNNWKPADYVNYYAIEKTYGFDKISKLLSIYPWLNITAALSLISSIPGRKTTEIREGKLDVSNYENAVDICEKIERLRDDYPFVTVGKFLSVFRKLTECDQFNWEQFINKIELNRRGFYQCAKSIQYLEMIEELYNRGSHEKNKVYFSKLIK